MPRERLGVAARPAGPARRSPPPAGWPGRAGRRGSPSGARPAAIAPEETSTTSVPAARRGRERVDERVEPVAGRCPPLRRGQRRRADLDHDPARLARRVRRGPLVADRSVRRQSRRPGRARAVGLAAPAPARRAPRSGAVLAGAASRRALVAGPARAARGLAAAGRCPAAAPSSSAPACRVGSQSKTTALSPVADDHGAPGDGARLEQRLLDPEPGEPVGEVADRLVVAEVGLAHPALGLLAAHPEPAPSRGVSRSTVKPGVVDGRRAAARSRVGLGAAAARPGPRATMPRPSRRSARAAPRGWPRRPGRPAGRGPPASGATSSASSRASGTSILLSTTRRGRSGSSAAVRRA